MCKEVENKLFLLGGHDLEMKTIAELLTEQRIPYIDAGLTWSNAKLSAYKDVLFDSAGKLLYGVELTTDILLPANYVLIDHHNGQTDAPSSLEQVAALLGVSLDRQQQLVAANDKGYIPAMRALGATDEEVHQIRRLDRAIQGVTAQEERQAEMDVERFRIDKGVIVVQTTLTRFSPICDRLYPTDRLLIYNEQEWTYYGKGIDRLIYQFSLLLEQGKCYYGGGPNGYFGMAQGVHTSLTIIQDVKRIIESVGDV